MEGGADGPGELQKFCVTVGGWLQESQSSSLVEYGRGYEGKKGKISKKGPQK